KVARTFDILPWRHGQRQRLTVASNVHRDRAIGVGGEMRDIGVAAENVRVIERHDAVSGPQADGRTGRTLRCRVHDHLPGGNNADAADLLVPGEPWIHDDVEDLSVTFDGEHIAAAA